MNILRAGFEDLRNIFIHKGQTHCSLTDNIIPIGFTVKSISQSNLYFNFVGSKKVVEQGLTFQNIIKSDLKHINEVEFHLLTDMAAPWGFPVLCNKKVSKCSIQMRLYPKFFIYTW